MKQLEMIYMKNVILYINNMNTLVQFIQINHKCLESCQSLYSSPFSIDYHPSDAIKIMKLFKKLNTFHCSIGMFLNKHVCEGKKYEYLLDKINSLELECQVHNGYDSTMDSFIFQFAENIKSLKISKEYGYGRNTFPLFNSMTVLERLEIGNCIFELLSEDNPFLSRFKRLVIQLDQIILMGL